MNGLKQLQQQLLKRIVIYQKSSFVDLHCRVSQTFVEEQFSKVQLMQLLWNSIVNEKAFENDTNKNRREHIWYMSINCLNMKYIKHVDNVWCGRQKVLVKVRLGYSAAILIQKLKERFKSSFWLFENAFYQKQQQQQHNLQQQQY